MQFALDEEQSALVQTVRSLLARHSDSAAVRKAAASDLGYDPVLWDLLCTQIGAAALAIPEEFGGAGFSLFETHLVLEELGAALTPSPLLGSGILAAQAILLAGDRTASERLLPGIAEGTTIAALAWADADGNWRTDGSGVRATGADDWRLDGSATLILDGAAADVLIVVASTPDGVGLFEVDPTAAGVVRAGVPAMDPTLSLATVELTDAPATLLSADAGSALTRLRDLASVAVTALQVGAAQRGLDMTVEHAKTRMQFGRAIGSFQALKHRMADMLVDVETARTVSWAAAWAATQDADLSQPAALAKSWCSEALSRVASETVQLHGGVAITWEHDAQLVFKRAHAMDQLFGQAHEHRRRYFELTEKAVAG